MNARPATADGSSPVARPAGTGVDAQSSRQSNIVRAEPVDTRAKPMPTTPFDGHRANGAACSIAGSPLARAMKSPTTVRAEPVEAQSQQCPWTSSGRAESAFSSAGSLTPYLRLLVAERAWAGIGLLLTLTTLLAGLGLLGLSGGFLAATAVAGLTPATAIAFNFFHPAAGVRFFAIARTASRWGERVASHEATLRLLARLRASLYRALLPLSPRQLGRHHGADLLGNLTRDIDALDTLYQRLLLPMGAAVVVLAVLGAWLLAGLGAPLGPVVVMLAITVLATPWLGWRLGRTPATAAFELRARLRRTLLDAVEGLEDFALHRPAWQAQCQRVHAHAGAWAEAQARLQRRAAALRAAWTGLAGIAAWAGLGLMTTGLTSGLALGDASPPAGPWLAAIVLVLLGSAEMLAALPGAWVELPGTLATAQRLNAVVAQGEGGGRDGPEDTRRMKQDASGDAKPWPPASEAGLSVRGLCFAYPCDDGARLPVLEDVELVLRAGEHVALVGPSGGGKSTLAALLAGLEAPDRGRIELAGADLETWPEPALRAHLACVTQVPWLPSGTLGEALRMACPHATDAQLWSALETVGLAAEVAAWPARLHTRLAEGGASLSGGQRRRLAIARALLRDARIYVFDEPSEGLETPAAEALASRLRVRLTGRSLLWISHRDEAYGFQRVLRLAQGRVMAASGALTS
ncbi:MAG: thiol reductant ABC exporter subunit CydC [Rhodocyclaceae bacterium]